MAAVSVSVTVRVRWCTRKPPTPTPTRFSVNALFGDWGFGNRTRNSLQQQFTFTLADSKVISVSVVSSISDVASSEWDACALDATGPDNFNPFLSHAFLSTLEHSASAVRETGWIPHHIVAKANNNSNNNVVAVVPLYLKTHSYGEFVFDHSWANAYHSYGYNYYPKLQSCVPFTPVTGPRILLRNTSFKHQVFDIIVSAMKELALTSQLSSLHVTFPSENEWHKLTEKGFLPRIGMQYHWKNRNYKKWGTPHLTREFFHELGAKMGDNVLLVVAEEGDELVAGALNLIGGDTLFGRLWGCQPRSYYPSLHFEACYYQAIEAAIELNLKTVEAGAQGEHKIQRGYLPVTTYSCHYLIDEEFREAIQDFLIREAAQTVREALLSAGVRLRIMNAASGA
ncbi:hypothetical protein JHK85_020458 [Glycine max]|nr:hypothetical protein JHK85_020458 [Glycine max]